MSRNETLFSKENWQTYVLHARPSNSMPTIANGAAKTRGPAPRRDKQMWTCSVCKKALSSKRSYMEHMNIHNKTKPFRCDNCAYAAASQMTLHRHKLRNHTPKTEWGYRCPYCEDVYMEPAGYQQHVQQRHPNKSATYGCPFRICNFSSKSQRHFRDHLVKHDRNDKIEGGVDPCSLSNQQLTRYMIRDEIGEGFTCLAPGAAHQKLVIRARPPVGIAPKGGHFRLREPPANLFEASEEMEEAEEEEEGEEEDVVDEEEVMEPEPEPPRRAHHKVVYLNNSAQALRPTPAPHRFYVPPRQFRAEPLPQTYDQIPREFEIEADPDDFAEMQMDEAQMDMEERLREQHQHHHHHHQHHHQHQQQQEQLLEECDDNGEDDDFDDEGPPVLDPQTHLVYAPEPHWIQHEIEVATNDVEVFPNGFIDDELD